jgi:AcrR family transcriptional regulator
MGGVDERAARARADIIEVATSEFAQHGYAGARVDDMADRMRTTKRMIYYYFGSKEALYLTVLERVYAQIRQVERDVRIDELRPDEALRTLAEATYDHHTTHESFIKLVSIENIHRAEHLRRSDTIMRENATALTLLRGVVDRGVSEGIFRPDVDAIDVHMMISVMPVSTSRTGTRSRRSSSATCSTRHSAPPIAASSATWSWRP